MRAFVAITPPEAIRAIVGSLSRALGAAHADVRWVPSHQLHLTLKFLEEISEPQRDGVIAMLKRLAAEQRPFRVQLAAVGGFPSLQSPRVLWVGVEEGRDALVRLAAAIERDSAAIGPAQEARPYAAHLTIGRVRSPKGLPQLRAHLARIAWQAPEAWVVDKLTLYESVLGSSGARHTVVADVPLRGG